MRNRRTIRILPFSLLLMLPAGCDRSGPEPASAESRVAIPVTLAIATPEPLPRTSEATGSTRPRIRTAPGSKILGRVERVLVREGDRVRSGQSLARLETRDLEASVAQARAAVSMADAQTENAAAQHRRMVELRRRGSVTDKNLEDALAAFRVAEAGLEQARANLAAAEVTLGYAEIRSPVAGWIVTKRVEAGDVAAPGEPLFEIEDLSRIKIVLNVPESDVVGLTAGDPARARIDVLEQEWEASIDRVIPAGDPASRTYEVQLVVDNPDGRIKSGMFARASFHRGTRQALVVPLGAIVHRGQLDGLFVVDEDSHARLRWVRLGRRWKDRIEVLSGLGEGERFVVAPPATLTDAAPVRVE